MYSVPVDHLDPAGQFINQLVHRKGPINLVPPHKGGAFGVAPRKWLALGPGERTLPYCAKCRETLFKRRWFMGCHNDLHFTDR